MPYLFSLGRPATSLLALTVMQALLPACHLTETTVSVRAQSQATIERVRLERPESSPVSGTWQQDGSTLVGRLAFTSACRAETVQRTKLVEVTDTHPNRRYSTGAYIAGAALSTLGLAFIANAQTKNEHVTCGSSTSSPRSGDKCSSEAGAWRMMGATFIGAGLGAILGGVMVANKQPIVTSKDLPSQEQVSEAPGPRVCGNLAMLNGSTVAATLSGGGKWTNVVDAEGNVRIDLSGASIRRDSHATLTVESVTSNVSPLVSVGTLVGELDLRPQRPPTTGR